jgi:hypothetical protein
MTRTLACIFMKQIPSPLPLLIKQLLTPPSSRLSVMFFNSMPAQFLVCKEAHNAAKKTYQYAFANNGNRICISYEKDAIYFHTEAALKEFKEIDTQERAMQPTVRNEMSLLYKNLRFLGVGFDCCFREQYIKLTAKLPKFEKLEILVLAKPRIETIAQSQNREDMVRGWQEDRKKQIESSGIASKSPEVPFDVDSKVQIILKRVIRGGVQYRYKDGDDGDLITGWSERICRIRCQIILPGHGQWYIIGLRAYGR